MHANTFSLVYLETILSTFQASWMKREAEVAVSTWTVAGAKYRRAQATYTPEPAVQQASSATNPTITHHLRSVPTEGRSIKRSFLNNWSYRGCAADDENLPDPLIAPYSYQLTPEETTGHSCSDFCDSEGYTLAALENGNECYCGNPTTFITYVDDGKCNTTCAGDSGQTCGGAENLSVWIKG